MMLEDVLKNNEAVALKDDDLEQVTGGAAYLDHSFIASLHIAH